MPITTVFDSANYIVTTKTILAEFIQDALPECEIVFTYPQHLELNGAILTQPLVWLREMPSRNISVGSGKETGKGKAVKKALQFMVYIIVNNNDAEGMLLVNQLSGRLESYFLRYSDQLGSAKLKHAEITPSTDVVEWANSNFVGASHSIFVDVLLMA